MDAPACAYGTLVLRTQLARACRHQAGRMRRVGRRQKPAFTQRAGARSAKPSKPQRNRPPLWCSASLHAPAPHAGAWMRAWCAAKANGGVASTPWQALQRLGVSGRAMGSVRRSLPELVDGSGLTRTSVIPEQPVLERKGAQGGVELASGVFGGGSNFTHHFPNPHNFLSSHVTLCLCQLCSIPAYIGFIRVLIARVKPIFAPVTQPSTNNVRFRRAASPNGCPRPAPS